MAKTLAPSLREQFGGAESAPEALLLNRIALIGLPVPQTQVQLIPGRKFRFDCVFGEPWKVACEVQGGLYNGRHTRAAGYQADAVKLALAQIEGYIVIYCSPEQIQSGVAGHLIIAAMQARGWRPKYG